MMNDKTVMIISERESIIVRSIEKKIKDMRIDSIMTMAKIDKIEHSKNDADLFVMYLPNEISEDLMRALVYLVDYAKDADKMIILIGEVEMKEILLSRFKAVKDYLIWFDRPLNIEEVGLQIKSILSDRDKQDTMKKILIVDDDPNYAKMVREWLKDSYKVSLVSSGAQSISFLSKNKVDLILLDYEMPIVDGPKVLQMLREDKETAAIPVIFLTGVGKKESVAKVVSLKPQGYILKSTSRMDLIMHLRDFFFKYS